MKLEINKKDSYALPKKELARVLDGASEEDLKVLLLLCAICEDGTVDTDAVKEDVSSLAGISETDFDLSVAFWRGAKVLKAKKNTKSKEEQMATAPGKKKEKTLTEDTLPDYTEEEIAGKIENTRGLKKAIDECQQIVGKIFSPADTRVIVGMSDRLSLSEGYIITLVAYCVGIGKKSLRYIEKTACALFDEGIDTEKKLEAYITKKEKSHEAITIIKSMLGISERELTAKEQKIVNKWIDEYCYDTDIIREAYELSVPRVENKNYIPYMGGIIDRWFDKGVRSIDEIKEMTDAYKKSREDSLGGFDTDDFFEKAVNRTKSRMKKQAKE